MLGAEFDKAMTVAKLKGARDRKSAEAGCRIEGRKGFAVTNPEAVALAKRLRRASPKTGERRSLRDISALLAEAGHLSADAGESQLGVSNALCGLGAGFSGGPQWSLRRHALQPVDGRPAAAATKA